MEIPANTAPAVSPTTTSTAGALMGSRSQLGKEDFLLMLVTQLSNQDPLSPMDGQEFAAQLAQFTSLEQLMGLNDTLSGQGEMMQLLTESMEASMGAQVELLDALAVSIDRSTAASLIGEHVEAPGSQVTWDGGDDAVPLTLELEGAAAQVAVTIRNAEGEVVRSLDLGSQEAGQHSMDWDGRDQDGNVLPPGTYTVDVQASNAEGQSVPASPLIRGVVERIAFGPEGVTLWISGQAVPLKSVRSVAAEATP